jgi:hypothetical protein
MPNVDDELDQQHGQGADELEGPEVDEQDQQGGDEFVEHGRTIDGLLRQARAAGFGDAPEAVKLGRIRKALRNTRQHIEAAERRGREKALAEFTSGDGEQAVQAIRQQLRVELQQETARERSLARLGIGSDSPVRSLFDGVQGDHRAFERHADLLRAAGVSWDGDPLVQQVARQRVTAWQQAAGHNGDGIVPAAAAGMPAEVQEQLVAQAVTSMQGAQAGGQPVAAEDLQGDIQRAAENPAAYSREHIESLAARFNVDLDALSRGLSGGPL